MSDKIVIDKSVLKKGHAAAHARLPLREGYAATSPPKSEPCPPPPTTERAVSGLRRPPQRVTPSELGRSS